VYQNAKELGSFGMLLRELTCPEVVEPNSIGGVPFKNTEEKMGFRNQDAKEYVLHGYVALYKIYMYI